MGLKMLTKNVATNRHQVATNIATNNARQFSTNY
jgi:hypothetical protein